MTTTTDTREAHLIDAAAQAGDVVVLHRTSDPIHLAQGDQDLIKGVQVLKVGMFNGVVDVTTEDLDLFTARFKELADSGTFVPPMRIDHSWDVLSVVGWFEDLYVQTLPDPTNGDADTPYLLGDVRLVGTAQEKATLREWIKSGKLRNRSSEIMSYRTNTGREYARIFAGCAFVDIPAVEGLAPITLRRGTATLSQDSTDTEGGRDVADSTQTTTEQTGDVVTPATGDQGSAASATSAASADEATEDGIVVGDEVTEEEDAENLRAHFAEGGLEAALRAAGFDPAPEKLAAVRAAFDREVRRERTADERLARYTEKGVIPLSVKDRVTALLRHDDDEVRDTVAALLDLASPRVALRDNAGTQTSTAPAERSGKATPEELRELSGQELGNAWAQLTKAERETPEYVTAYRAAMNLDGS